MVGCKEKAVGAAEKKCAASRRKRRSRNGCQGSVIGNRKGSHGVRVLQCHEENYSAVIKPGRTTVRDGRKRGPRNWFERTIRFDGECRDAAVGILGIRGIEENCIGHSER